MQSRLGWMIAVGLGGLIAVGAAIAAPPLPAALYTGTGTDYMNDATGWTADGGGAISFQTSSDGKAVTDFRGGYSFYCGSGTATVTERRMSISKAGRFSTSFKVKTRGPRGKINGTAYVEISGLFSADRQTADVSYLVDYVFKGRHVKHPYATQHPRRLGCASWVKGTVTASAPSASSSTSPSPA